VGEILFELTRTLLHSSYLYKIYTLYDVYINICVSVCMYSRTTVDGMMIIIVKLNVIYMTHQLIARKRIQEEEKRKHTTLRKRKYNLWDLENAAGYCNSTAQHSALYVNWNNIWIWQHSFSRRLYVIESPRIHFSFGFFDLFDWEYPNAPRSVETVNGNGRLGGTVGM